MAVEVFAGNTADPAAVAAWMADLKSRFGIEQIEIALGAQLMGLTWDE